MHHLLIKFSGRSVLNNIFCYAWKNKNRTLCGPISDQAAKCIFRIEGLIPALWSPLLFFFKPMQSEESEKKKTLLKRKTEKKKCIE